MNLRTLIFCFATLLFFGRALAQTVSIKSDDAVCLNEVIGFESVFAGTATSYLWNFGNGTTSTQKNPSHTFAQFGAKTITLTVTFSGGNTQTATKTIEVHDVPVADFSLDNSIFCFLNQNICLTDNSNMGSTTSGYSNRRILWGDGQSENNTSPSTGDTRCYTNYPTFGGAPFNIVAEVVNDKGCESKWQQEITILPDYKASFRYQISGATCDDQEVCFINDSANQRTDIQSIEWDFGDGATSTSWSNVCHKYIVSGTYTAKLKVTLKNGCVGEYARTFRVRIFQFEADFLEPDSVVCFPESFALAAISYNAGASYTWELYNADIDTSFIQIAGYDISQPISVPCPGNYMLRLKVAIGQCVKFSRYIHLKSEGVSASFKILNKNQCAPTDTMYFVNLSKSHPDAVVTYLWDFDDENASNCIGWPANCNSDDDKNSRHFYTDTGCYKPKLVATDATTGCTSELEKEAIIWNPADALFVADISRPCLGNKQEYGVTIIDNMCENVQLCGGEIDICKDSAANPQRWDPYTEGQRIFYPTVTSSDGWITVGFTIKMGSSIYYNSHDTTNVLIDASRECVDTTWYTKWYSFNPEPVMDFVRFKDTFCLPITTSFSYQGDEAAKLKTMKYSWNTGEPLNLQNITGDSVIDIKHTYTEEGQKNVYLVIEDTFGCYNTLNFSDVIGYENSFTSDTIVCLGKSVEFVDLVRYYGDANPYWRSSTRPEKINWDFDDGLGFNTSGPTPKHTFSAKGIYNVRMATNDKNGCLDTAYSSVSVGGINAAIVDNSESYLCDQILQFLDSSYFDFTPTTDYITDYFWDFGDNTRESLLKNPFHYYNRNGAFVITLAVKTKIGCVDTAQIPIYLVGPEPYFDIISDTVGCVPFTATFMSKSKDVSDLIWRFGDSDNTIMSVNTDTTISFTYKEPGTYYVSLEGNDSFYNAATDNYYSCAATFPDSASASVRKIVVLPIPEVSFDFEEPACVGNTVLFQNTSDSIYTDFNWQIETFDTTTKEDLSYIFSNPGRYSIVFSPTYIPNGAEQRACYDTFENSILVTEVSAGFTYEVQGLCSELVFTDTSRNASTYSWNFGHPSSRARNTSDLASPSHTYGKDKGEYTIYQAVSNEYGCTDTFYQNVEIAYVIDLKVYNVFTPNDDGPNDVFHMDIENYDWYDLKIFNRYGELVFTSNSPAIAWNGKQNNTGTELPASTYFYVFQYRFNCDKQMRDVEGIVDLIR